MQCSVIVNTRRTVHRPVTAVFQRIHTTMSVSTRRNHFVCISTETDEKQTRQEALCVGEI